MVKKTKKERMSWGISPDLVHGKAADIWPAGMHKEVLYFLTFFFSPSLSYGGFLSLNHFCGFRFVTRGTCRLVLSLERSLLRRSFLTQHHVGRPESVLEERDLGKEGCWVVVGHSGLLGVLPGADSSLAMPACFINVLWVLWAAFSAGCAQLILMCYHWNKFHMWFREKH